MTVDIQAWVGTLLVVGGRAVSVPPPGMVAETAPRRANRARESDTFFALITPAEGTYAPAAFYEELAQMAADVYFGSGGGATGGLREALSAINTHLIGLDGSGGAGRQVCALAVVLRGQELFAARSGRMFGALVQGGEVVTFPADRRDPLIMNLPPLGFADPPDIQLARYEAGPGVMLLLADDGLADADRPSLWTALSSDTLRGGLNLFKALAGPDTSALVIRFAPPSEDDPGGVRPQASDRAVRASRPAAVSPSEPEPAPLPEPPAPASPQPDALPAPGPAVTPPPVHLPEAGAPPAEQLPARPEPVMPPPERAQPLPPTSERVPAPAAPRVLDAGPGAADDAGTGGGGLRQALGRAGEAVSSVSGRVQSSRERSGELVQDAGQTVQRGLRGMLRAILVGILAVISGLRRLLDFIVPQPESEGKQGISTGMAALVAVLIPLVIVIVVLGLSLSEQGQSDFEVYRDRAKDAHAEALELSGGTCDDLSLRPTWREVLRLADQAAKFRPNDLDVRQIQADAQNYLDCFDKVQRHTLTLLHEFQAGAELVGPIVHGGVDLYTLDRTTGAVYHDTLNETGDGLTTRSDRPIFRTGTPIGPYVVGEVFDVDWLLSGGTVHDNVLVAADRSGLLISYSPTFFESAQQLIIEGLWVNPVAIAVFESNLYVLDAGASQIWRYVPTPGERRYANAPEEYFIGENRPDLTSAVDFGISADEGAIYILYADGTVLKYRRSIQGVPELQPFEYSERPAGAISAGAALFVDNDPASRNLYVADPDNRTIYETSWAGTFRSGYRPHDSMDAFDGLSGFYADAVVRNNMYVVAGNRLYHFHRDE